jgi:hypothetical protein
VSQNLIPKKKTENKTDCPCCAGWFQIMVKLLALAACASSATSVTHLPATKRTYAAVANGLANTTVDNDVAVDRLAVDSFICTNSDGQNPHGHSPTISMGSTFSSQMRTDIHVYVDQRIDHLYSPLLFPVFFFSKKG